MIAAAARMSGTSAPVASVLKRGRHRRLQGAHARLLAGARGGAGASQTGPGGHWTISPSKSSFLALEVLVDVFSRSRRGLRQAPA